jgi:gliding motility-associated-like protein
VSETATFSVGSFTVDINNDDINFCDDGSVLFSASPSNLANYNWTLDGDPQTETSANILVNAVDLTVGTHNLAVEATLSGCPFTESDQVDFTIIETPDPIIEEDTIYLCPGQDSVFTTLTQADELMWQNSFGNNLDNDDSLDVTSSGIYTLTATNFFTNGTNGSCSATSAPERSIAISVSVNGVIAKPPVIKEGESSILQVQGIGDEFQWFDEENVFMGSGESITVNPESTTIYTVQAVVASCAASDTVRVDVRELVSIPHAFSPNGDNTNDTWSIDGMDSYPEAVVRIYNRWGNRVYETRNYAQNEWNGTHKGTDAPVGTYYYVIEFGYIAEEFIGIEPQSGYVMVIR